jgi:hypothetical protein
MSSLRQSKIASNIRCAICGQGFLIHAEPGMQVTPEVSCRIVQHALRGHHASHTGSPGDHPASTFHIPTWSGAKALSASASLSNLLDSAP